MPAESLPLLTELSQFVDETANLRPNPRCPWVGASAFSHKGGTHVNAVQKVLSSYEHVDPASVGNTRHVLISDLAGRSNIVMKARELGFDLSNDTPHLRTMLARDQGARAPRLRVRGRRRIADAADPPRADERAAAVHGRRVSRLDARRKAAASVCEATVKVRVGNERAHTVADGDGPVNALDAALRVGAGHVLSAARRRSG